MFYPPKNAVGNMPSEYFLSNFLKGVYHYANTLLETVARPPKGQVKLVLLWGFAECGNRKALRLRAQGVYSCK